MAIKIAGVDVINDDRELVLAKLTDINETINDTAVDVFIYDTSKDSDGGAWRHRTQHTSWYAEASSASRDPNTRSTRAEFPSVAVIVAEANKVTIYDGDDPSLPMWMVFNAGSANALQGFAPRTSAFVKNASLVCGSAGSGLAQISFISDLARQFTSGSGQRDYTGNIATRNDGDDFGSLSGTGIINLTVNDVAMTVLPDAPTDPATGLPVPTIAVATQGGVSVIKDDGTVVDSAATLTMGQLFFDDTGGLFYQRNTTTGILWYSTRADYEAGDGFGDEIARTTFGTNNFDILAFSENSGNSAWQSDSFALGGDFALLLGLMLHQPNYTDQTKGMSSLTTSDYTTGWMPGDIKLAALANSATADRSVNNNPLTQNGTITAAPVATGADVVGYSGFSASNYLEQPYNADLDFGTDDFSVMFWFKGTDYYGMFVTTDVTGQVKGFYCAVTGITDESNYEFMIGNGTEYTTYSSSISTNIPADVWTHVAFVVEDGDVKIYENGSLFYGPTATTRSVAGGGPLTIGYRPWDNAQNYSGSLALLRISATAPTADQIRKIYEDEKVLFQPNAKATLTGNSDAVTALAHDPDTELLHVGTSGGRSVFQGLRRVEEHTGTNSQSLAAISAVDGLVVEGK